LDISENSSITFVNDSTIIISRFAQPILKQKFFIGLVFIVGAIIATFYYKLYEDIFLTLMPIFFLCIGFFNIKTELRYLFKFKWMHEKLIINPSHFIYKVNGKSVLKQEFNSWLLCFNIENNKLVKADYNEVQNIFNPMLCIIKDDYSHRHFFMHTIGLNECVLVLDELEKWYIHNNVLNHLKIYRSSIQEITEYQHRYWKSTLMRKTWGIV
jgi:hypothetical protein